MSTFPPVFGPFLPGGSAGSGASASHGATPMPVGRDIAPAMSHNAVQPSAGPETPHAVRPPGTANDAGKTSERLFQAQTGHAQPDADSPARVERVVLTEAEARAMAERSPRSIAENLIVQRMMAPPPIGQNLGAKDAHLAAAAETVPEFPPDPPDTTPKS